MTPHMDKSDAQKTEINLLSSSKIISEIIIRMEQQKDKDFFEVEISALKNVVELLTEIRKKNFDSLADWASFKDKNFMA